MFRKARRIGKQLAVDVYNACFNRTYGQVLMLHRIGPKEPERLHCLGELRVSVEKLQSFVDERRKHCDFVSLDEVYERVCNPLKRKRPFICFTLDDGFRDNLTEGLPFFEKNGIPFAVFLTTAFVNRHPAFNYPFIMERMIKDNDELIVEGQKYYCKSDEEKNATFVQLKKVVLQHSYVGFEEWFERVFAQYINSHNSNREDLTLTWKEVQEMTASSLCTIGSHTMTHCRLSNLSEGELEYELGESKRQIEENLGKPCDYISYPFGWTTDVNEDVFKMVQKAGYKMGLVSHGGGIRKNDMELYNVKRIMFSEDE